MGKEKTKSLKKREQPVSMAKRLTGMKVRQLLVLLVIVVGGTVLFVGAASGWFSGNAKVTLDAEYYCGDECDGEYMELEVEEYEELVQAGKSFVVLVDQGGCKTADRLREFVADYAKGTGMKVYRMMFAEVKESSLHEYVKYYPSVVIVSKGQVIGYLRADSDEDAEMYNDYDAFTKWIKRYL